MSKKLINTLLAMLVLFLTAPALALVDPTQPETYVEPKIKTVKMKKRLVGLQLESILIAADRKIAAVNGKLYQVGDKLSGLTVKEINADHIVLKSKKGLRTLKLLTRQVKK